jgi:hypothetical protein
MRSWRTSRMFAHFRASCASRRRARRTHEPCSGALVFEEGAAERPALCGGVGGMSRCDDRCRRDRWRSRCCGRRWKLGNWQLVTPRDPPFARAGQRGTERHRARQLVERDQRNDERLHRLAPLGKLRRDGQRQAERDACCEMRPIQTALVPARAFAQRTADPRQGQAPPLAPAGVRSRFSSSSENRDLTLRRMRPRPAVRPARRGVAESMFRFPPMRDPHHTDLWHRPHSLSFHALRRSH